MGILGRIFPQIYTIQFYKTLGKVLLVIVYAVVVSIIFGMFTTSQPRRAEPIYAGAAEPSIAEEIASARGKGLSRDEKVLLLNKALLSTDITDKGAVMKAGKDVVDQLKKTDDIESARFE